MRIGERLFSFHNPAHQQIDCDLCEHDGYGIEAQFWKDRVFWYLRRFETRVLAVAWAERERTALLGGTP